MTLSLPDIHLTDLGTNSDGITPADLTRVVLKAVTTATVKAVSASASDLGKGPGKPWQGCRRWRGFRHG